MKNRKYDLSKLTREQVENIVKSINSSFSHIENFMSSSPKKASNKKDLIQLIDVNAKKGENDVYGRYHPDKHYVSVVAWDPGCYWRVAVWLFEDHFEIPEYKVFMESITKEDIKRYCSLLNKYLGKKNKVEKEKELEL